MSAGWPPRRGRIDRRVNERRYNPTISITCFVNLKTLALRNKPAKTIPNIAWIATAIRAAVVIGMRSPRSRVVCTTALEYIIRTKFLLKADPSTSIGTPRRCTAYSNCFIGRKGENVPRITFEHCIKKVFTHLP